MAIHEVSLVSIAYAAIIDIQAMTLELVLVELALIPIIVIQVGGDLNACAGFQSIQTRTPVLVVVFPYFNVLSRSFVILEVSNYCGSAISVFAKAMPLVLHVLALILLQPRFEYAES